jgi:hypothetical protein
LRPSQSVFDLPANFPDPVLGVRATEMGRELIQSDRDI